MLSSSNQDDFTDSSSDLVSSAIESYEAEDAVSVFSVDDSLDQKELREKLKGTVEGMLEEGKNTRTVSSTTIYGDCGGSATYNGSETSATFTYNSYDDCYGTIDGSVTYRTSTSGSNTTITIRYNSVTVDYGDEVYTISGTDTYVYNTDTYADVSGSWDVTVTYGGETNHYSGSYTCSSNSCTYTENMVGDDGEVYQTEDLDVSGNSSTGCDVSATFYDPDYGYVTLDASNIILCDDGIASGTITLSDDSGNTLVIV